MVGFEAWENELFNEYNGEGRMSEEEFWANAYEELRGDNDDNNNK